MSKIVNLRQARKARARADKRAEGDATTAKHGRTAAERRASEQSASLERKKLDAHRRETPDDVAE